MIYFMKCGCTANAKRKVGNKWVPSCVIHNCIKQVGEPNLNGRFARCCTEASIKPSTPGLAFFRYRGEGSMAANDICKNCGYAKIAHDKEHESTCKNFEPHGVWDYDLYYCGHAGWD